MANPINRRTVLAAGVGAAGLSLPGMSASAGGRKPAGKVRFTLDAQTLDGGEQITSLTLDASRLGPVDPASLITDTFRVHAVATLPFPLPAGETVFTPYDLDREVTAVRLDRRGNIVLELSSAEGQLGGGTLGYLLNAARNVRFDLDYTIIQQAPIRLRHGGSVTIRSFVQGRLSNPEVDAFSYHVSRSGMNYRLYSPDGHGRGDRPLIVWLHGGGEGGLLEEHYYDNETPLRANRGALGFATPKAQRIFGDAYVVAPQCPSYWIEDGPRFAPLVREIITDLARRYRVDRDRIYLAGCSNGGYMTMELTSLYRNLFAAAVPICGVVDSLEPGGPRLITDDQLRSITTPTWLVASADDTTVPPEPNSIHAHDLIRGSKLSLYEHVIWDGYQFPGHWSWIYVARNDPSIDGTHIWQWMARQRS